MARVPGVSAPGSGRSRSTILAATLAVLAMVFIGWLGWRLLTESAGSTSPRSPDGPAQERGEIVQLAPGAGVELRLLGWQHASAGSEGSEADSGSDRLGSATALATVRNVDSRYSEFILDVAAVDERGSQILGFGTAQVLGLPPGEVGAFTLTIPDGIPESALLGVANIWGRTPGDPQIHPINFTALAGAAGADGGVAVGSASDREPASESPWTEPQLMKAASQFAASVAAMQRSCRADPSLAGLVCLSRRNFPDFLLAQPARELIRGHPFFHQESDPSGPPRAFELTAPGDATACVGQRIDKQTSDQVAIVGSCIQRGLFVGNGTVQSATPASTELPAIPEGATRVSIPVGDGGLPGAPVDGGGRATADSGDAGIGDTVVVGPLDVTVEGVQVGITEAPGMPPPEGTYTLVTITGTNRGSSDVDLRSVELAISEVAGGPLPLATIGQGASVGWPPLAAVLAPGASVRTTVITDVTVDQTAGLLTIRDSVTGAQQVVSLLPPLS